MTNDFPSVNGLTWQEWRTTTFAMESTANPTNRLSEGPPQQSDGPGTLSMRIQGAHLYFIRVARSRGPVKIGRANDPETRLKNLQVASPYRLRLLGVIQNGGPHEAEFHRALSGHRLRGEWFTWSKHVEEMVKTALAGGDWRPIKRRPTNAHAEWFADSPLYEASL